MQERSVSLRNRPELGVDHVIPQAAAVREAAQVGGQDRHPVGLSRARRATRARAVHARLDRRVQAKQVGLRRPGEVEPGNAGEQDRVEVGAIRLVDLLQRSARMSLRKRPVEDVLEMSDLGLLTFYLGIEVKQDGLKQES